MPGQAPILGCIIALPLLGSGAVLAVPARLAARPWFGARAIALTFSIATLAAAARAIGGADLAGDPRSLLLRFRVFDTTIAADALSLFLLLLVSALAVVAAWASYTIRKRPRHYYSLVLLFLAAALAALLTQNTLTYILCLMIGAVALASLLSGWGADRRVPAARHFLYFALFAGIALLAALLLRFGAAALSGSLLATAAPSGTAPPSPPALWLFLLAGAALTAILPAHWWLADAVAESATPLALLTVGVWQTLGTYTVFRLAPSFHAAAPGIDPGRLGLTALPPLALLATATVLYAALAAFAQPNLKRFAAFLSIALMGFTLLGYAVSTPASTAGAGHLLIARPLAITLLLLVAGMIEQRLGHCDLPRLGGLAHHLPSLGTFGALALLAATALPPLATFPGTLLIILGTFQDPSSHSLLPIATILALASLLAAAIVTFHRAFLGTPRPEHSNIPRLSVSERYLLSLLTLASLIVGLFPSLITNLLHTATAP